MKIITLHIVTWWYNWQCDRAFYVQSLLMWLFLSQKGTFFFPPVIAVRQPGSHNITSENFCPKLFSEFPGSDNADIDKKKTINSTPTHILTVQYFFYHMHTDMWLNHTCLNITDRIQNLLICN